MLLLNNRGLWLGKRLGCLPRQRDVSNNLMERRQYGLLCQLRALEKEAEERCWGKMERAAERVDLE